MKTIYSFLELKVVMKMQEAGQQGQEYSLDEEIARLTEEIEEMHPMTQEEVQALVRSENRERRHKRKALIAERKRLELMQSYADEHRTTADCR